MINSLQRRPGNATCAPPKRRPKGWTLERRARQAARARETQPWRHATGPRSETGKARSSMNGLKHGYRSRAHIFDMRRARYVLRLAARNIAIVRAHLRLRRLEDSLRHKPETPFSKLQLNHFRGVLEGITASPMPERPTFPLSRRSCGAAKAEGIGFWLAQR
jgi:hypothetical protein